MEKLLNKIKENGYWKVIIRPTDYEERLIKDKDSAPKIIESSKIALRGWSYPYIDSRRGIVRSGKDSVASYCDWPEGGHFEFWKFYLNGQFVHYFSMVEDYQLNEDDRKRARESFSFSELSEDNDRFLSIINTLYTVTEIFLFAANLAKFAKFSEETDIIIELGNVEGRTLFFWGESHRILFNAYTCMYQPIEEEITIKTEELIKNPKELALNFTMDIFKEFNWKDVNKEVFIPDQNKLLERRF